MNARRGLASDLRRAPFKSGTSTTFSRSGDAFGVCTPWKRGASMELVPGNGANSLQLTVDGGIYLNARGPAAADGRLPGT
jgi:hypothetical protein